MKQSQCVKFKVGKNNGIAFFEHISNNLVVHVDSDGKKLTDYREKQLCLVRHCYMGNGTNNRQ